MAQQYDVGDQEQLSDDDEMLKDIAARIDFFDPPPDGFNPLTAERAALIQHGIPLRPDETTLPNVARFWDEMYTPPLHFTAATMSLLSDVTPSRLLRMTISGQRESSLNWSGAYITPRDGEQLTEVHGRWVVPGVGIPMGKPGGVDYHSSTWIGFDGQRRYFDSSLPQIGTVQRTGTTSLAPYAVWWQWWLRNNPITYKPVEIPVFVIPGQRIMASLRVLDEYKVHFSIVNRSTGQIFPPFTLSPPTDAQRGFKPRVSGATAEWIVERPSDPVTHELEELADYTQVTFTDCLAVSAVLPPGSVPGAGRERNLDGARVINMYDTASNPSRRVTISRTERPEFDRFETNYSND